MVSGINGRTVTWVAVAVLDVTGGLALCAPARLMDVHRDRLLGGLEG